MRETAARTRVRTRTRQCRMAGSAPAVLSHRAHERRSRFTAGGSQAVARGARWRGSVRTSGRCSRRGGAGSRSADTGSWPERSRALASPTSTALPGQPVYETFAACAEAGLRPIGTRHQQAAALMAAAHNYFAGRQKAATIVSAGVPAANALGADRDRARQLLAARRSGRQRPAHGAPATSWRSTPSNSIGRSPNGRCAWPRPARSRRPLRRAFEAAMHGRPGPVLVQLPENVLTGFAPDGERATLSLRVNPRRTRCRGNGTGGGHAGPAHDARC